MTKVGGDRRGTDVGIELEKRVGIEDGGDTFKFHGLIGRNEGRWCEREEQRLELRCGPGPLQSAGYCSRSEKEHRQRVQQLLGFRPPSTLSPLCQETPALLAGRYPGFTGRMLLKIPPPLAVFVIKAQHH